MNSHRLSKDLSDLVNQPNRQNFRIQEFVDVAGDRGFGLIFLILALPSALPLPATGISTPLGLAMFVGGLQMLAGRKKIWLPQMLQKIKVSKSFSQKMVSGLNWVLKKLERFLKPRWPWLTSRFGHLWIGGLVMALSLVMQIPIPLTNTLPAAVIFVLALCQTEDDGLWGFFASCVALMVVIGYIVGFVAIVFFGFQGFEEIIKAIQSSS